MLLSELAKATAHVLIKGDAEIERMEYDSRNVMPGDLFCCVTGTFSDGHAYAHKAADAGAAALMVERELDIELPQLIVPNTRVAMAELACAFYGYPSREMKLVGVTGTNGKTSTTYMLKAIAEEAGMKVGLIGTIRNLIGDRVIDTERTTPASVDLQHILREMKNEGVELVIMEVSSHALDQARVHGMDFDVGVFTNLTQDHLDYHKTFENYLAAKKQLFVHSRRAVINADDPHFAMITEGLSIPITTFGIRENADYSAGDIEITTAGVSFDMRTPQGTMKMRVNIPGLFSVFNAMGAAATATMLGFTQEQIRDGIGKMLCVSGRLEPLPTLGGDYSVLLDYAHTPDALENVLKTIRGFARGRVVTLFGCGGNRDKAKRPIMGEIAGRYSDFLIVTSDNPRDEDPMDIISSVLEGVNKSACPHVVVEDRRAAIKYALQHARPKDVILLAGKGHENYQEIGGGKRHFDEKEIVAELLEELRGQ